MPERNQGKKEFPQWIGQDNDQDRLWAVDTASTKLLNHLPLLRMKDEESFLL